MTGGQVGMDRYRCVIWSRDQWTKKIKNSLEETTMGKTIDMGRGANAFNFEAGGYRAKPSNTAIGRFVREAGFG